VPLNSPPVSDTFFLQKAVKHFKKYNKSEELIFNVTTEQLAGLWQPHS